MPRPAMDRRQVRQRLHQVGGRLHIAAPLRIVARYVGLQAEDGRVLVEPEVRGRRERHNPIRRPVPSITHMAIRTW